MSLFEGKKILKIILDKVSKKIKEINGNEEVLKVLKSLSKNEEFINEVSSDISNWIDINNTNTQNINLCPKEFLDKYDNCKNELNELKKTEYKYIVKYSFEEKILKSVVKRAGEKIISAHSERDAELIFKDTKAPSESLISVVLKDPKNEIK